MKNELRKANYFSAVQKPINAFIISFILIVYLVLTGCGETAYTVKHEKTKDFNFKNLKTYAWLPYNDSITVAGIDQIQLMQAITSNIEGQLFKRNLAVDTIKPDMLIRYSIMLNNSISVVSTPIYEYRPSMSYGYHGGYYGGYSSVGVYSQQVQVGTLVAQVPYRNGQLIIDLIDHASNKVIWRGYAYGSKQESHQTTMVADMRKKVEKIVGDIFWYFPIKK